MSFEELQHSVAHDAAPPAGSSLAVQALWHDARGNWDTAHTCAQDDHGRDGSWVHAYLHRKEGDLGNASYWYHRANQPVSKKSLTEEWNEITQAMLD